MKPSRLFSLAVAASVLTSALFAQEAPPLPPFRPPANDTSTLRLWGNRNMESLAHAWAAGFQAAHPEIKFEIKLLGNGTAMPALYCGVADLALFGRDTNVTDNDGFAHVLNYKPLHVELGTGSVDQPGKSTALVLFVHRDNPLTQLTLTQVDAIFSSARRRGAGAAIRTWGQLGLTGDWADQPIHLYADDAQSPSGTFFQHAVLQDSLQLNWEHFTEYQDIRHPDGTSTEAAQQSMAALRADRYGLAISNLHYLNSDVKPVALAVQDGGPFYAATRDTLISRNYPLTRTIFACANQRPGQALDPKVRDFLRYILSPAGQRDIIKDGNYLPLSAEATATQLQKLP
jgi:phosphate transport system substrate-binding protein